MLTFSYNRNSSYYSTTGAKVNIKNPIKKVREILTALMKDYIGEFPHELPSRLVTEVESSNSKSAKKDYIF